MLAPVHDIVVAWIAEVVAALAADKLADRAAVHALEVNELISMLCAHVFAEADFLPGAWPAEEVLLACLVFGLHRLLAILHSAKVGLAALEALVESAEVDGEALKVAKVRITLSDNAAASIAALISSSLDGQLRQITLFGQVSFKKHADDRDDHWELLLSRSAIHLFKSLVTWQLDLRLAAWAIKIAEGDAERASTMLEELSNAVGVVDMATG